MPALILDWTAAASAGPDVCGGKGWNLGRLRRWGFPVPDGAVLTAGVYRRFMGIPELDRLCGEIPADVSSPAAEERLAAVRAAMEEAPLPQDAVDAVRQWLETAGFSAVPLAVRSSATAEDGGSSSFAGVHRSVLGVTGADAVLRAVRGVYASLWTPQALSYRRRFGIPDARVACAVAICRMVPAKAAGVAFTCDPRNGRRDVVAISAAPGLGEGVVGGSVNPQEITAVFRETQFVVERSEGPRVLDNHQAVVLARCCQRAMWAFGDGQDPQDIEWAWDGERFHILQVRPVTVVPRVVVPGSEDLPLVWSNANIRDAIPFVMTASTWSTVLNALRLMLFSAPEQLGYPIPRGLEVARRFGGRGYFDITTLQWTLYDAFGLLPDDFNRTMGGHHEPIPVPPGSPYRGRRGWRRVRRLLRSAWVLWRLPKTFPPEVDAVFAQARKFLAVDLKPLDNAALGALIDSLSVAQIDYSREFMRASAALAWLGELEKAIEAFAPGRGPALAAALVAGTGRVVSAQQGTRLFDVADAARHDPEALEWLRREPLDPHGWKSLPPASPFQIEFRRFLADFGHRSVYEGEIATPRWNEDPTWLLEQVRSILDGAGRRPDAAAKERCEAAEREIRRLTFFRRGRVFFLARRAREGAWIRELAKSGLVANVAPLRKLLLETGLRLVAAGRLDAAEDAFHFCWADVEGFLRGEWDGAGARELVADRKAEMERWRAAPPPDVIRADGRAVPARAPATAPDGKALRGVGVSPGRATGPARVLHHPSEGHRLKQGDILVAPSTDPGWTPLFLRAAAVVVETGGMLSHGAIVAREYGLPAVSNVPGLLQRVKDGQTLTVDGDAGTITPE